MRAYNLSGVTASRRKAKKMHKKAKRVAWIYLLGLLVMAVLSLLPCLQIKYEKGNGGMFGNLCVINFFRPIFAVFSGKFDGAMVGVIYLVMLIVVWRNLMRSFSYVHKATKKNYRNVSAFNRNVAAMEELGDIFSSSFATMTVCYFLMYLLTPMEGAFSISRGENAFTLMGYIALAVGLIVHFVAGTYGGTSSLFLVGVTVEEKKRKDSVWLYFLRNFIQVVVVVAIVYMVAPVFTLYKYIPGFTIPKLFKEELMVMLGVILQLIATVFIVLLLVRATSSVEFGLTGMEASGMRKYAIFVLIAAVLSVGLFIVDKDWLSGKMIYNYLIAALAGIAGFVLDLLIRPKDDREDRPDQSREVVEDWEEQEPAPEQEKVQETAALGSVDNPLAVKVTLPTSMDPTGLSVPIGDAPMFWEIKCPVCDKTLSVKDGVMYNRCPSCGKVFQVRKGKKGIPNE
ncbi:MAG: hypothetical protein IJX75_03650 [Clostridia bacterium]|nr:hypothetical protein [Clostridia bacterium]